MVAISLISLTDIPRGPRIKWSRYLNPHLFSSRMQKVRFRGLTLSEPDHPGKDFVQLSPEQIKECKPLKTPMEQFSDKMLHKALNHIGMRGGGRKFMEKAIRNLDPKHKILIQSFLDKRHPRPPKPLPLNAPFAPEWITHKKKRIL